MSRASNDRRARRLVRCYPEGWRDRYGEEFVELLIADIGEQPRSWRRGFDVVRSGLLVRLASTGLTGPVLGSADQIRAGLATLGCAAAVFLVVGVAMWSQLTIGWQWSAPATPATSAAMVVMSGSAVVLLALGALAMVPIGLSLLGAAVGRRSTELVRPSLLLFAGLVVMVGGARHFASAWPGTGGHHWIHQGLVPGGLAAFMWSSTLSVSSYWVHPAALSTFPPAEVAWMVASPPAMVCLVTGAAKIVRRLELSPRVLRYEGHVANVATLFELVFLVGSCEWIVSGGPGPRNLFHAGAIDVLGLAVLATAMAVGHRAARRGASGLAVQAH